MLGYSGMRPRRLRPMIVGVPPVGCAPRRLHPMIVGVADRAEFAFLLVNKLTGFPRLDL